VNNDISLLDDRISSIEGSIGGSYDDSELRGRIESLEEMSENYARTEMIPTLVSQLDNDSGYISETYDDSELRQMIEDNELVTSASLNDLNDRVSTIESADYATETYVDNAIENLPSGGGSGSPASGIHP